MAGLTLKELGIKEPQVEGYAVKAPVFPFERFWVDPLLGPEMKSTGEVMGLGETLGEAFAKTQLNLKSRLPMEGGVFLSVNDSDKKKLLPIAYKLHDWGFRLYATRGTAAALSREGIPAQCVLKLHEGHPNVIDLLGSGEIKLVINTPLGRAAHREDAVIRLSAMRFSIPYVTTIAGAEAACAAIEALREGRLSIRALKGSKSLIPQPQ
jgi:carbamoyl-phosphate synthase large subunit